MWGVLEITACSRQSRSVLEAEQKHAYLRNWECPAPRALHGIKHQYYFPSYPINDSAFQNAACFAQEKV